MPQLPGAPVGVEKGAGTRARPEDAPHMPTRVHGLSRAFLSLALLPTALLMPRDAAAEESDGAYGTGDPAVYLGVSALAAFDDRNDLWFPNWDSADVEAGANVRAGVRIGPAAAVELQGDWVDLDDWDRNDNWTLTMNFRVYPSMYEGETVDLRGMLPDFLQPYLVAGVGTIGGTGDGGDDYQLNGAFRLGAGGDLYLSERVAVSFGYEWITGTGYWSERDARNLVLGLQYNF